MTAHVPRLRLKLDPLIKEANRRMRRRRLFLAGVLAASVAALAAGLTLALRPGGQEQPRTSGGGTLAQSALPRDRLIVLDRSIGPVHLGESRTDVEKALGRGRTVNGNRFLAIYFGGRLRITYGDKGLLRPNVMTISTGWVGFHTASGLRVGASAASLYGDPRLKCLKNRGWCISALAWHQTFVLHHADFSPVTSVSIRHGLVAGVGIA